MSLLLLAYILSFIDRQVLGLLAPEIKSDMDLTDTEVGLLLGPAFALTYVFFSFPLGWFSDSVNRMRFLALGTVFWTLSTMACGLTRNFWQLAFARGAVGVGEAVLTPAAWSLLADSFPPHKRSLPVSIYLIGPYVGNGLALIFGAIVLGIVPAVLTIGTFTFVAWQSVFIIVALPGLLLAVVLFVVREPKRQLEQAEAEEKPSFLDFFRHLKSRGRIYLGIWMGSGLYVVLLYGLQAWTPTYMMRVHGWDIGDAGYRYGIIVIIFGSLGVLLSPFIHRFILKKTRKDHALTMSAVCGLLVVPFGLSLPFVDRDGVLPVLVALSFLVTIPLPQMTTTLQLVTPNYFRGRASSISVIATNILGLVLGPPLIGALTDYVFGDPGMLGYSMAVSFTFFGLAAAACFYIGAQSLVRTSPLSAHMVAS